MDRKLFVELTETEYEKYKAWKDGNQDLSVDALAEMLFKKIKKSNGSVKEEVVMDPFLTEYVQYGASFKDFECEVTLLLKRKRGERIW